MKANTRLSLQAALLSALILLVLLGIWHVATLSAPSAAPAANLTAEQIEYQKMLGKDPVAAPKNGGFPTLSQMAATIGSNLAHPVLRQRPQRQGHRHPARLVAAAGGHSVSVWRLWSRFRSAS